MKKKEFILSLTLMIVFGIVLITLFILNKVYGAKWMLVVSIILLVIELLLVFTIRNFYEEYKKSRWKSALIFF